MKNRFKVLLGTMVLMVSLLCLTCPAAFASTSVNVYLNGNFAAAYDTTDLSAFTQEIENDYSSYYCKGGGSYRYFQATGPSLEEVLADAIDQYNALHSTSYSINDLDYLNFYDVTWNTGNLAWSAVRDGYYYSSPSDLYPDPVDPIIALEFCEVGNPMSSTDCLRNFHGQPLGSPGDDTMSKWCKDLDDIYLTFN